MPNRGSGTQTRDTLGEKPDRISPTVSAVDEERYWREAYQSQPYYDRDYTFDDYAPAYRAGYEGFKAGKKFGEVEGDLRVSYEKARGKSRLAWEKAKHAAKAAWDRVSNAAEEIIPGDSDRDGH